ncbi:MAG TPA: tetrahydrofolate dehydrogenase/cyclohydrolase catalytic domain-containing protein, partial [Terriglobales bacterium]
MYGRPVADAIERKVQADVEALKKKHHVTPRLDVVLVGKSAASQRYVQKKLEACERLGMQAKLHTFDDHVSGSELRDHVARLSDDDQVHGILVQLPLPRHIEEPGTREAIDKSHIFDAIKAEKDVDGISRYSIAELYRAQQNHLVFL